MVSEGFFLVISCVDEGGIGSPTNDTLARGGQVRFCDEFEAERGFSREIETRLVFLLVFLQI